MSQRLDPSKLVQLREFVRHCKENPDVLHLPELKFFKDYVESFSCIPPDVSDPEPVYEQSIERKASPQTPLTSKRNKKCHPPEESKSDVDKSANVFDIVRLLSCIACEWNEIGIYLRVPLGTRQSLSRSVAKSDIGRLEDIIQTWLNATNDPPLPTLLDVLEKDMNNVKLGKKIRQHYGLTVSTNDTSATPIYHACDRYDDYIKFI